MVVVVMVVVEVVIVAIAVVFKQYLLLPELALERVQQNAYICKSWFSHSERWLLLKDEGSL